MVLMTGLVADAKPDGEEGSPQEFDLVSVANDNAVAGLMDFVQCGSALPPTCSGGRIRPQIFPGYTSAPEDRCDAASVNPQHRISCPNAFFICGPPALK